DAVGDERFAQRADREERRVVHRNEPRDWSSASGNGPVKLQPRAACKPMRRNRRWCSRAARLQPVVDREPGPGWRDIHRSEVAGMGTRRDGEARGGLVALERTDARCVVVEHIVPRPSEAKHLVVEGIVVPDDASADRSNIARLELVGPVVEYMRFG